jgi:pimeloyl-ACP methyl ester carboxylesterase
VLHVVERGTGPGVLLIHGAGPSADQWTEVIDDLAADHHVVAYNRRGYPGSGDPIESWDTHIDDAIGLIEERGLAPAIVAGHSAGSIVAAGVAARRPELVARTVLLDPILFAQKRPTVKLIATVIKVQRLKKKDPRAAAEIFYRWATAYNDGSGCAFDRMAPEDRAALTDRYAAVFADMDAGDGSKELKKDQLARIPNPTIALGAKSDRWFTKNGSALSRRIPGASVVTVDDSAHAMTLDNPGRVAEIIRH